MVRLTNIMRIIILPLSILALLSFAGLIRKNKRFDINQFDGLRIKRDLEYLSSPALGGKRCGTEENRMAMEYVAGIFKSLGLKPAVRGESYFQPFKTVIPDVDNESDFHIADDQGRILRQFIMHEDFSVIPSKTGGSIDYFGDLVLTGQNLYKVDPTELIGKVIIVESILLDDKRIDYIKKHGGMGVLFVSPNRYSDDPRTVHPDEKSLDLADKRGSDLFIGSISVEAYRYLKNATGIKKLFGKENPIALVKNVRLRAEVSFPPVQSANVLGVLQGRRSSNRILLISSSLDGLGRGPGNNYFPGAVNSNSGTAALLETARVLSAQKNLPFKTVVFAVFNGEENNAAGAGHYVNNPVFPLEKTTVIHLDNLGAHQGQWIQIRADASFGNILRSDIIHIAGDSGLPAAPAPIHEKGSPLPFLNKKAAAVQICSNGSTRDNYQDTPAAADIKGIEYGTLVLLNYLKRSVYKDASFDYLDKADEFIFGLLLTAIILNYLINSAYGNFPNLRWRDLSMERIYYNPLAILLKKSVYYFIPLGSAVFLLVFIVHMPPDTNLKIVNGEVVSNFSLYLSVKETLLFLKGFFASGPETAGENGSLTELLLTTPLRSFKMLSLSLLLSLAWGVLRGTYESWHNGKNSFLRSTGTLISASVPDVVVVIAGLWLYVAAARRFPAFTDVVNLKDFALPLITLSILPAAYISRVTSICIREELGKDYVRNARAGGFGKFQIYAHFLAPPVLSKVFDSFSSLSALMLTNLIIVEYLFDYKGIIYYLLYFYKRSEGGSFIILSFTVALLYLIISSAGRLGSLLINPLKRKGRI